MMRKSNDAMRQNSEEKPKSEKEKCMDDQAKWNHCYKINEMGPWFISRDKRTKRELRNKQCLWLRRITLAPNAQRATFITFSSLSFIYCSLLYFAYLPICLFFLVLLPHPFSCSFTCVDLLLIPPIPSFFSIFFFCFSYQTFVSKISADYRPRAPGNPNPLGPRPKTVYEDILRAKRRL